MGPTKSHRGDLIFFWMTDSINIKIKTQVPPGGLDESDQVPPVGLGDTVETRKNGDGPVAR